MRPVLKVAFIFALSLFAYAAAAEEVSSPLQARLEDFLADIERWDRVEEPRRTQLRATDFDAHFPPDQFVDLSILGAADVKVLFLAAANASRLVGRNVDLRLAERAYVELGRRGLATAEQTGFMHGIYVQSRQVERANTFAQEHPEGGFEIFPPIRSDGDTLQKSTLLIYEQSKNEFLRRSVAIGDRHKIIVVAHPRCRYARAAMDAIAADQALAKVFLNHSTWIVPPDFKLDLELMESLALKYPHASLRPIFAMNEWPMIDEWATPTFYFLQHGEVSAKVVGWPEGGRRQELLAALEEIGL